MLRLEARLREVALLAGAVAAVGVVEADEDEALAVDHLVPRVLDVAVVHDAVAGVGAQQDAVDLGRGALGSRCRRRCTSSPAARASSLKVSAVSSCAGRGSTRARVARGGRVRALATCAGAAVGAAEVRGRRRAGRAGRAGGRTLWS